MTSARARSAAPLTRAALCLLALLLANVAPAALAAAEKPNVVVFLADDLGWADVGYRGSEIETPAIDGLAREGVRLERFYSAPICSPTRAALMTGRDPLKLGLAYDQIHPWYNAGLPPDAYTIADAFAAAGYQTGLVGKWHLGHTQAHQLPMAHGFEHFHGHLQTNTDYFTHRREGGHDLQLNGLSIEEPNEYLTHIQAREAVRFVKERKKQKPFFLYVPFTAPHSPMQAPAETIDHYAHLPEQSYRRIYAAMVHEMDRAIGQVLAALDEEGLTRDTVVLFFSDNGGYMPFGASNQPLRGQKGQTFEGGIRVPAVLRWPGSLPAGKVIDDLVTVMDVFPTLARAANVPLKPGTTMDGVDMWPAIASGKEVTRQQPLFFISEIPIPGLIHTTVIDGPWKLVQIVRERQTETQVRSMLFRIEEDPEEKQDLAAKHPREVERLAALIGAWRSRHPMAGTRGTLVPHPGWVPPKDWAEAVQAEDLLQSGWTNELPFSKQLIDATAERGVLVDDATRERLRRDELRRQEQMGGPSAGSR
jgi:arylsulfatase A-like enzyme